MPATESRTEVQPQEASSLYSSGDIEPSVQSSPPVQDAQKLTPQPPAPASTAALSPSTSHVPVPRKPDYSWLAGILLPRIEALKQYPVDARLKHIEGRVVLRIVIQEDGQILSAAVARSSGHETLDQAALETIRKISALTLTQPLEQSPVTIHVPIRYQLGP